MKRHITERSIVAALLALVVAMLASCATPELSRSQALIKEGRPEEALKVLQEGMQREPYNVELRTAYFHELAAITNQWMAAADAARTAGRLDEAQRLYLRVQSVDPTHQRSRDALATMGAKRRTDAAIAEALQLLARGQIAEAEARLRLVLAEDPANSTAREALQRVREQQNKADVTPTLKTALVAPLTLEFRDTPLRSVFDVIARTAGLNFVFDKDVRTDTRITIFIRSSPIEDVIRLLLLTNQLASKVLNDNSLLIYPSTPAKTREYQELVARTFFLANADVKQAQALVRTVVKSQNIYVDEKLSMITVRDTPEAVRLAERLIATIDIAEPEVMLEVEVLELSRTKLQEIGINYPTEVLFEAKLPIPFSTPPGRIDLSNLNSNTLIWTIANPAVRINLLSQGGDVTILANPRIRSKNREKARIMIGEKLPVFTSTAVPNAGVASSVTYIDVGLKLEVEPNVYLDNEVAIKLSLEVSNTLERVRGPDGTIAYRLGTRSAQTNLRVRDGETQVLGGLISNTERATLAKLPGLGDLPVVGRLFGSSGLQAENTEIVLLITPRIVRNLRLADVESFSMASGTEAAASTRAVAIRPTAPRALAMSGGATRPGGAAAAPAAAPAVTESAPTAVTAAGSLLIAPSNAPLGQDFSITVQVSDAAGAQAGEATVAYDPAQLVVAGAEAGRAVVRLAPGGGGSLAGTLSARVLSTGSGVAQLDLLEGSVRQADGTVRPLAPSSVSVRVGP